MQAAVSLLMAAILVIWTAVTFRQPLPRPLPDNLGINYNGLSAIAVMPISLFSASVFRCAVYARRASWSVYLSTGTLELRATSAHQAPNAKLWEQS